MAEALAHRSRIHRAGAGLQGQGRAPSSSGACAGRSIILAVLAAVIVVRVAHPLALLIARPTTKVERASQ